MVKATAHPKTPQWRQTRHAGFRGRFQDGNTQVVAKAPTLQSCAQSVHAEKRAARRDRTAIRLEVFK
jgi:hypothetical protein